MSLGGLPRPVLLGGVALLAALVAVATERTIDPPSQEPRPLIGPGSSWQAAGAGPLPPGETVSGCGLAVVPETLAVTHPALPCGLRIVLEVDGVQAEVQVAGRAPGAVTVPFGLTPALARALGVRSETQVRWALSAR